MQGDFLMSADVARLLDITPATVRDAANAGRLKVAATTPQGVRLFLREDVEAWRVVRDQRRGATPVSPAAA
jgi:DNA-binding transcriptional MerR regulator